MQPRRDCRKRPFSERRSPAFVGASLVMAAAVLLAAVMLGFGPTAKADAPGSEGWWTSANPGSVGGVGAPTPAPPDVPSNGLLIEGGPSSSSGTGDTGASAYAALRYDLPDGATVGKLTLAVAPNSATTPSTTLELCPLTTQDFQPEEGGPMSDAPSYNCTNNVTAAQTSSSYQFDAASLVSAGALAIAILPTSPADRVVLSQPDTQSLAVQVTTDTTVAYPSDTGSSSGATGPTAGPDNGSPTAVGSAPAIIPATTGATPSLSGVGAAPAASSPATPSLAPPKSTQNATIPGASTPLVASTTSDAGPRPWVGVIFLVVLLAAAAFWMGAGRSAAAKQAASSEPD